MARRGAGELAFDPNSRRIETEAHKMDRGAGPASRSALAPSRDRDSGAGGVPEAPEKAPRPVEWRLLGESSEVVKRSAGGDRPSLSPAGSIKGGGTPTELRSSPSLAPELEAEILAGSSPGLGRVALAAMARARQAYARDRFLEAQREIKRARSVAPDSPAVLELSGLISYRLERWAEAVRFLDRFESLTGSIDQLPVVADCYRALGDFPKVQHYFERVRHEGASAAVVMEARLVMAGALADQGRLGEAIEVLGRPRTDRRNPALHHLRQWYALADLLERAGDIPNARLLFAHVAAIDPELGDVEARLSLLGAGRTRLHRASPSSSTGR